MSVYGLVLLALGWSGLVWLTAQLICLLKPRPKLAQGIWRAAAALLLLPFAAAPFMPGLPAPEALPMDEMALLAPHFVLPGEAVMTETVAPGLVLPSLAHILIGLVVTGWGVRFLLWIWSQVRLQHIKHRSCRVHRPVSHWAQALGLAYVPEVRMVQRGSPFLAGCPRPAIYVPAALLDSKEACPIIVHEMVHLKRGDLFTRPFERAIADLFWFTPFAWLIRERLDYWREAVVDEDSAALTGDPIAYARALTRAARLSAPMRTLPVAAFNLPRKGTLKMRLSHLLDTQPRQSGRMGLVLAAAGLLAVPLALAQGTLIKGEGAMAAASVTYTHPVLDTARLTSRYGARIHPITGEPAFHNGADLAHHEGSPVYAPAGGIVTFADEKGGYGNLVSLQVSPDVSLSFAQLLSMDVAAGDVVKAGEVIGLIGQSGQATGPHLHLEVRHQGNTSDPEAEKGLVLARELHETAPMATPAVPAPPAPPKPASAPEPAAAPQPLAALDAPRAPEPAMASCDETSEWSSDGAVPAAWNDRIRKAKADNLSAGFAADEKGSNLVPLSLPAPYYPDAAIKKRLMGACEVLFDLSATGEATNVTAVCSDDVFVRSAIEGMKAARFEPILTQSGERGKFGGVVYPLSYCFQS